MSVTVLPPESTVELLKGVRKGLLAGTVPTARSRVTLGPSKGSRPLLVCLDMKDWIQLGRAHYGKSAEHLPALTAVRRAIASGTIVVPLTGANLLEAGAIRNDARRKRMADFMVDLSGNHSVASYESVQAKELECAVAAVLTQETKDRPSIRRDLLDWGIALCLGAAKHVRSDVLDSPEVSALVIASGYDERVAQVERDIDQQWADWAELARSTTAHLAPLQRFVQFARGALLRAPARVALQNACSRLNVPLTILERLLEGDDGCLALVARVPSIDTFIRLQLWRDQNPEHRVHRNDLKDLLFLSATIPYADLVVTDKAWAHVALQSGVAASFATEVCRDVQVLAGRV